MCPLCESTPRDNKMYCKSKNGNCTDTFLAHSCWKHWMKYCGEADVDGSCRPWTEVVFRRRKLHCGSWTEAVSHATPLYLEKVKINFDEAQKLTWKEIKCLYGLIKIITSNLDREAEMFISTHAVTTQKSIRGSDTDW